MKYIVPRLSNGLLDIQAFYEKTKDWPKNEGKNKEDFKEHYLLEKDRVELFKHSLVTTQELINSFNSESKIKEGKTIGMRLIEHMIEEFEAGNIDTISQYFNKIKYVKTNKKLCSFDVISFNTERGQQLVVEKEIGDKEYIVSIVTSNEKEELHKKYKNKTKCFKMYNVMGGDCHNNTNEVVLLHIIDDPYNKAPLYSKWLEN